ncbi:MAG TPA: amylo-alpha-1,6-glucosidase [Gammaproteobacteria bacterium]|nr:amylo-alpha-1,6-glucosidase [Gammaproteobacteria bacterium]
MLEEPFLRARDDLESLAIDRGAARPFLAAGVPWFLTLFGRDSLLPAIMAGLDGSWSAEGALAALQAYQAREYDDFRDEQPGKFPHELRDDELTFRRELPYSPYFGTHDAPSLYCLTLWNAWRWTGDDDLLSRHIDAAMRGLEWCERHGDLDGDGLQEYETRSRKGYRNQGWKDAGDAIVDGAGRQPDLPLATVELQAYLYAARLAVAELFDRLRQSDEAQEQRRKAHALRQQVEERFWLERAQFYALALDGDKRCVDAIASNAGHLLWCGMPRRDRAAAVARRLLADDMFSGWGLRTLSSHNPAYNPLSYQRGSVWPFDTVLAAAGLFRYGEHEAAFVLMRGVLEAAQSFESSRLPELFGGFPRSRGVPVPYEEANIPQAWSSAVPIMIAQLILGLVPDAPRGRCHIQPRLPEWLAHLSLDGVRIGRGEIDIRVSRRGGQTVIEHLGAKDVEVLHGEPPAVLWGTPLV